MMTNRRTFLGSTALFATSSWLESASARSSAGGLKLGIASYSLRKFSRPEAIRMVGQMGIAHISIKSFHLPYELPPAEVTAGSNEFREAGIEVLSGGNIDLANPVTLRSMFEYARAAGLPMMICAPSRATLDQVEVLVKEFNIRIAIHNHGPEDRHFPTPESALEVLQGRDPRMGVCIDVGHTTRTGTNVLESIRRSGPRLFDFHIKDLRNLMDGDSQCDVGEGAMPVAAIFQELIRMNFQGGVMLEYEINEDDPLLGMAKSIAYMRGVLDGLAV